MERSHRIDAEEFYRPTRWRRRGRHRLVQRETEGVRTTTTTTDPTEAWAAEPLRNTATKDPSPNCHRPSSVPRLVVHASVSARPAGSRCHSTRPVQHRGVRGRDGAAPPSVACLGELACHALNRHQVEHLAAELFGITLGHRHGFFGECRDPKSSKATPDNRGTSSPDMPGVIQCVRVSAEHPDGELHRSAERGRLRGMPCKAPQQT